MIDVSEGSDPRSWVDLPTDDRMVSGGSTVWLGNHADPLVVAQPNRWGVIESVFPSVPSIVEVDEEVSGSLLMPDIIVGFRTRSGAVVEAPRPTHRGMQLMERAAAFGRRLSGVAGITIAAEPFARTIPLLVVAAVPDVIAAVGRAGITGLRILSGIGGGVALTVRSEHTSADLEMIAAVLADVVAADQ